MRIVTWNVNGLRSLHTQGYWETFRKQVPFDILCLQETKSEPKQLPAELSALDSFHSFFSSSKGKKGYSGVATYSRSEPKEVSYGIGEARFDDEGRVITAVFDGWALVNVYVPNGGQGPQRLEFKYDFLDAFLAYLDGLRAKGLGVVFCGDINIAHEAIDLARPKENEEHTGFLPEERAWVDEAVNHGYVDVFRHFYPDKKDTYTYWDQRRHDRDRNVGWRIDYFFMSPDLVPKMKNIKILSEVFGSDHCPVLLEISH